ncbi:MAG: hypothetical protein RBT02_07955 [Bacteroidales bacterium]|jgi:hypothetical protein|nr:hypothetical protein [Bacteroidales bacterium]
MRTTFLYIALLLPLSLYSQDIRVKSVKRVRPANNGTYLLSGVVTGSRNLLVAGEGYKGLSMLDIRNGKIIPISSEEGAGYDPAVTDNGRKVLFRTDSYSDNRKYSSVYSYDIESGDRQLLVDTEREVLPPVVSGNRVLLKSEKGKRIENYGTSLLKDASLETFVVIEDMMPVIYQGAERKPLMPNGEGFYIWASLSPDGSMILYNYQGRNTYISDTDGKVLYDLGRINAPRWLNDNMVIGMDDRDDGYRITGSELVYYSLTEKKRKVLTNSEERSEMFPFPMGKKKIAFTTDNGEIFIMKVRVR